MSSNISENVWARFHCDSARRERHRLIGQGVIVPAWGMKPQLMVRQGDGWVPQIVGVN